MIITKKGINRTLISTIAIVMSITSCKSQENNSEFENKKDISKDTLTMLFVGDLMQHQSQIDAARRGATFSYDECFNNVSEEIKKHDFSIANLEVPLGGKPYSGYPVFSSPDEFFFASHKAGFNIFLTANNHSLDKGKKGLERTIDIIRTTDAHYLGTYKTQEDKEKEYPLILERKGFKIALLNYTYGTNGFSVVAPNTINTIDTTAIAKDIQKAKAQNPDVIIACMHWGNEYVSVQNKVQENTAKWLLSKGVNHIIGAHPHVIQPIKEIIDEEGNIKNIVAYSLGNFISNMSIRKTDGGMMLKLSFTRSDNKIKVDYAYSLVYTDRPKVSGKDNYDLITISRGYDTLSNSSKSLMDRFLKDTRELLKTHSPSSKEYTPM